MHAMYSIFISTFKNNELSNFDQNQLYTAYKMYAYHEKL